MGDIDRPVVWHEGDRVELHGAGWWDGCTGTIGAFQPELEGWLERWIPVAVDGREGGVFAFRNHELTRIA